MLDTTIKYPLERDEVINLLQAYGISTTRQRIEIAGFLFQKPQHLSAEKILEGVNAEGHSVSRATVYNTMGLFARKGLVREVLIDRERVFYDSNNGSHYHIYNQDTGELKDFTSDLTASLNIPQLADGQKVVDSDVIIRVTSKS